jgi:hypothetical protein
MNDARATLDPETGHYIHNCYLNAPYEYLKVQFMGQFELYLNGSNQKIDLDFNFTDFVFELKDMAINGLKIVYTGNVDGHCLQYILCR